MIPTYAIPTRQPQGSMSPMEVVIEELQTHERIPRVIAFGKRMGLAGKGTQPVT